MGILAVYLLLAPFVLALPANNVKKLVTSVLELGQSNTTSCDPNKCAGECVGGVCKIYALLGEECGGPGGKKCQPCDLCYPYVLGLVNSKGRCRERLRCNDQWCDDGFCVVTQLSTGAVTYLYNKSAPPLNGDTSQKCVKWGQVDDRCGGGNTVPPTDYQHCAPPLVCYRSSRTPSYVPGLCRLPTCKAEYCTYKGQSMVGGFCGTDQTYGVSAGKLNCKGYRQEGEPCGGVGPTDAPLCDPSRLACVKEGASYVCRVSNCLATCTGEYCLPDANGANAVCGGIGAPSPNPYGYYSSPTTTTAAPSSTQNPPPPPPPSAPPPPPPPPPPPVLLSVSEQQLGPLCCSALRTPAPAPVQSPPPPTTFLELANKIQQLPGCCPNYQLCPQLVGIACSTNPYTACSSCATSGLYSAPSPAPTYTW